MVSDGREERKEQEERRRWHYGEEQDREDYADRDNLKDLERERRDS